MGLRNVIHSDSYVLLCLPRWVFLYEKGYQSRDGIISSVSVKLKGLALTNISGMGPHIWDVADYVFPPQVRKREGFYSTYCPLSALCRGEGANKWLPKSTASP